MAPFLDEKRIDNEESIATLDSRGTLRSLATGRRAGAPRPHALAGGGDRAGRRGRAAPVGARGLAGRHGCRVRRARAARRAGLAGAGQHPAQPAAARLGRPPRPRHRGVAVGAGGRSAGARRGGGPARRLAADRRCRGVPAGRRVRPGPRRAHQRRQRPRRLAHPPVVDARPGDAGGGAAGAGRRRRRRARGGRRPARRARRGLPSRRRSRSSTPRRCWRSTSPRRCPWCSATARSTAWPLRARRPCSRARPVCRRRSASCPTPPPRSWPASTAPSPPPSAAPPAAGPRRGTSSPTRSSTGPRRRGSGCSCCATRCPRRRRPTWPRPRR